MIFWDTSALLPLLVTEASSAPAEQALRADPEMAVWYSTWVEIESAFCRREREGLLPLPARRDATRRLEALAASWIEVNPTPQVRARAIRLLRVHPLRAADSMQLAAALILCRENPSGLVFLSRDQTCWKQP